MGAYILRRVLLMIPTLFGIMLVSFLVVQFAPGGPVEQFIAQMQGQGGTTLQRVTGSQVGSSRVDLQACKLEYSIVSPK